MKYNQSDIGKVPLDWEIKKIQEVGTVVAGGTPRTKVEEYWNGNISWITPRDLSTHNKKYIFKGERSITKLGLDESSARLLPAGTVLFSSRAPIGYTALAGKEMATNQGFKNIICDELVLNNHFMYYLMQYKTPDIENLASGSTFNEVSGKIIKEFKIPVPKIYEQKAIADTLSALDDRIEINNKISENLEKQAQALFKHWFVDFEFPNENGEPYRSSGGEMVDSELGMIPEGWEVGKLSDISTVQNGFAFKSKDYVPVGCPVIRTLNIENNLINNDKLEYLSKSFYKDEKYAKYKLNLFDTLLVMVGSTIGKIGMVLDNNIPSLQNQNMWRFRPLNSKMSPFYIHYQVHKINNEVSGWDSGSARSFYRKGIFQDAKLVLPKKNIISKFHRVALNIFQIININQQKNEKLAELRDTLLPKLMSGELRIPLD